MQKIKILSPQTVNQIAAGEVIERPASVVKELVENSLDAGADEIHVEAKKGGKELIKVKDNGVGMSKDELKLAFEKHATSKIEKIEDLDDLKSLGFRGEALPSIAAVSKVRAITKQEGDIEGTEVTIHGGDIKSIETTGCPVGTQIEVGSLFYNTPARKKHMKKTNTELAHISEVITRNSLAREDVQFKLVHNSNELLFVPKSNSILQNIKAIYGKKVAKKMVHISDRNELLSVEGFISKPEITRSTRKHIFTYVNSRYVENKILRDAIVEGYGTLLPKRRYPIVILKIHIDGEEIDVNVHPTKTKIRFFEEDKVKESIANELKSSLLSEDLVPSTVRKEKRIDKKEIVDETSSGFGQSRLNLKEIEEIPESKLSSMRVLGVVKDSYIVTETPEGIAVVDQHAAHERINYEKLKRRYHGKLETQELVSPKTLDFKPREAAIVRANYELLSELGFDIEHFGKTTFRLKGVPVVIGEVQEEEILYSILDELMELKGISLEERREEIIKYMACHSSVRAGDMLSISSSSDILEELGKTENPYTCPHGRPTIVKINEKEMKKWFKRT